MGSDPFGAAIARKEDPALLRGRGCYVDDIHLPGMLEAAFVRSPFPHARIARIDVARARAMPGVRAVIAHPESPRAVSGAARDAAGQSERLRQREFVGRQARDHPGADAERPAEG